MFERLGYHKKNIKHHVSWPLGLNTPRPRFAMFAGQMEVYTPYWLCMCIEQVS
jgi:hypothetical protein